MFTVALTYMTAGMNTIIKNVSPLICLIITKLNPVESLTNCCFNKLQFLLKEIKRKLFLKKNQL